jgi:hypothetical protein
VPAINIAKIFINTRNIYMSLVLKQNPIYKVNLLKDSTTIAAIAD